MTSKPFVMPGWKRCLGDPEVNGEIRLQLEDFRVQEIPLIEPSGEGVHLWLEVEKRGANTNWVAEQLAAASGAASREVGFAGMKDRHGVTTQWFSVSLQEARNSDWETWDVPDVSILQAHRHSRKLKRGALTGNRFKIVVRNLQGDKVNLEQRLAALKSRGAPNYFGPQRFGFNGNNIERGVRWLEQGGRLARNKRSIYISAVRSFLFNHILSQRIAGESWDRILDGEIAMLNGSHSLFVCVMPDPELSQRCAEFDIHPTGPLPGNGGMLPERQVAVLEQTSIEAYTPVVESLKRAGLKADRRALRVLPGNLEWELEDEVLTLAFDLPAGAYATSILRELVHYEN